MQLIVLSCNLFLQNVSLAHAPDIMVLLYAIMIKFEEASKSRLPHL